MPMSVTAVASPESSRTLTHWTRIAHAYHQTESPLHPCSEDIAIMERFVAKVATQRRHESRSKQQIIGHHNALLLGVTPAIATMKWPRRSRLLAVDSSEGMLDAIWPGDEPGVRLARAGNWLTLPVKSGSCTTVIGDGSFNCVAFPTVVQQLAASVARVLKEDGVLILRLYVQPERAHSLEQYFDDLLNGRFQTFDAFKFLLCAALVDAQYNVTVQDVWRLWSDADVDEGAILQRTGWSAAKFETIAYYKDSQMRYSFPTLDAAQQALSPFFDLLDLVRPSYPLGDCCPILLLRKRRSA